VRLLHDVLIYAQLQDGYSKLEQAVKTTIQRNLRPRKPKQQRKLKAAVASS
jgi:hypothetical protein